MKLTPLVTPPLLGFFSLAHSVYPRTGIVPSSCNRADTSAVTSLAEGLMARDALNATILIRKREKGTRRREEGRSFRERELSKRQLFPLRYFFTYLFKEMRDRESKKMDRDRSGFGPDRVDRSGPIERGPASACLANIRMRIENRAMPRNVASRHGHGR